LANSFFTDTGLLVRAPGGWIPADEVIAYHRTYEWDKENAARELQPILAKNWFWETLQPKLGFRAMEENDAVNALGAASAASSEYRQNFKLIIDYLVTVGMIERDGTTLKLARQNASAAEKVKREETQSPDERAAKATSTVTTGFVQRPGGAVQFHINIDVSMTEFAGWTPERISAFFNGMAKVLAAKSGLEQEVTE
jgi:phage anti-repressor protein